jgi:hypothetical protein
MKVRQNIIIKAIGLALPIILIYLFAYKIIDITNIYIQALVAGTISLYIFLIYDPNELQLDKHQDIRVERLGEEMVEKSCDGDSCHIYHEKTNSNEEPSDNEIDQPNMSNDDMEIIPEETIVNDE